MIFFMNTNFSMLILFIKKKNISVYLQSVAEKKPYDINC
jgi:hypothetical protein